MSALVCRCCGRPYPRRQAQVLVFMLGARGTVLGREVAEALGITHVHADTLLVNMEERGLVKRLPRTHPIEWEIS